MFLYSIIESVDSYKYLSVMFYTRMCGYIFIILSIFCLVFRFWYNVNIYLDLIEIGNLLNTSCDTVSFNISNNSK